MTTRSMPLMACASRRQFLILGGAAVTVLGAAGFAASAAGQVAQLVMSTYPRKRIVALDDLAPKTPVAFRYPDDDVENVLVRLGERAGGGVGPQEDIVAFNTVCTHMGGYIGPESFKPQHSILGPCPLHLTTFDLTRHGMVVSGHATASLPQIVLEVVGGDILAVGVMGLLYGYNVNPRGLEARSDR